MKGTNQLQALTGVIFQAMNSRDFTRLEQYLEDRVIFDFPGADRAEGSRRTLLLLKSILRKYPELKFRVLEVIAEEGKACAVWTNEGVDIRGNPYRNSGITLMHFTGGKISFISDYFKDTSFKDRLK